MERPALKRVQAHAKGILSKQAIDRRVAAVDGYLLALETLFDDRYTSLTLDFTRIDGTADHPLDAVTKYHGPNFKVALTPMADWKVELARDLLEGFLSTSLRAATRERLAETFVVLLNRACSDTASAWRVMAEPTDQAYYHCAWRTYLFPTPHGLFLLHCAIDD